ncbi:protein ImuB [Lipingzhangella halophila]|uniref:Protein ImuB n=1 Tax=Lipingzhangella halophila TaxID=1783352 RepID=A0A7W7W0M8_9ACTN|nr:DNA polymerase Y family protein [Lipingzhangella halophila]MBB4930087.1 protein ImuB [Lipingzhangella halophila]
MSTAARTLAVWCPDWPVTAAGFEAATPSAVVAKGRVVACSRAARTQGVRRGQRKRDAQRLCADLLVQERDTEHEGRLFEPVVRAVTGITPWVEVVRPGVCVFSVHGPVRYFGGEHALREAVVASVAQAGYWCGAGIADGVFAAVLAARARDGGVVVHPGRTSDFLAPYPVRTLERPALASLLERLGVRRLGELAALPADLVAERFGDEGRAAHRLATGLEARPAHPAPPREDLSVCSEFDPPADRAETVVFEAKALAARLHSALAAKGLLSVRVVAEVTWADGRILSRLWRHDGALSELALAERVLWQLSGGPPGGRGGGAAAPGTGAAEGTGGVIGLRFVPDHLVPATGRQVPLWGQAEVAGSLERAVARVQGLLGHQALVRPALHGGRGPGEGVVRVPVGDVAPDPPRQGPWPGRIPAPDPTVVPSRPPPALVLDANGEPVTVSGRAAISAPPARIGIAGGDPVDVDAWAGPWPAVERWWDPERGRRRARLQVAANQRAYLLAVEAGQWHVEAVYD